MTKETDVLLALPYLRGLIMDNQWGAAIDCLSRFLPPSTHHLLGDEAQVLLHFLRMHKALAALVTSNKRRAAAACSEKDTKYIGRSNIVSMAFSDQQVRASLDWERVRERATEIVTDLAYKTPELNGLVYLPAGCVTPHNVLPIGYGFRPRRHVRQRCQPEASAIVKLYLEKR